MQQRVDVAVAVGLGLDGKGVLPICSNVGLVVRQARHLLLLHQCHLLLVQPEVGVRLQQRQRAGMGVPRRHDGEGQLTLGATTRRIHAALQRQDALAVQLQVAGACGRLRGQRNLDAGIAQTLAQAARNQDEGRIAHLLQPHLLRAAEGVAAVGQRLALGLL